MTVGELKELLSEYDDDRTVVVVGNNGAAIPASDVYEAQGIIYIESEL